MTGVDSLRKVLSAAALVLLVLGLFCCTASTAHAEPTVFTDLDDYAPGDTALISGAGFHANETVVLQVIHLTDVEPGGEGHDAWAVTTDAEGSFASQWYVNPDDSLGARFLLTADCLDGLHAEWIFTDGNVRVRSAPSGVVFTLTAEVFSAVNCGGSPSSTDTDSIGSTVGAGKTYGVGNTESIRLTASATSTAGGAFINWTSSSPFTVVGPRSICVPGFSGGGTREYFANYDTTPATAPTITCPANITVNAATGLCSATVSFSATATGNPTPTITYSQAPGSSYPVGTTTVTATATNSAGSANCTFNVTVQDTQNPTISCPANIVRPAAPGTCSAVVTYPAATANDNCSEVTVSSAPASGSLFSRGTTVVTATATDGAGNTATCTFTVSVVDQESPTINCPADIERSADSDTCAAEVSYPAATASDNCGSVLVNSSPASGSAFPLGVTIVTATATDTAGNSATCTFSVTIRDAQNPTITCPANIVRPNEADGCSAVVSYEAPAADDNCPGVTASSSPASGSVFPVGVTVVTATATDGAGNTATCTFTVTVEDDQNPEIECPADVVQATDAGACSAVVNYPPPTASDNCTSVSVTSTPASGSEFPIGATVVTAEATDASGNSTTCTFTVTVEDREAPTIDCPADIEGVECTSHAGAVVEYEVVVNDNCLGATFACDMPSGGTFPIGHTVVTCQANDLAGNTATCTFLVEVRDTVPPLVICPSDADVGSDAHLCSAAVDPGEPFASDVCGVTSMLSERSDGVPLSDPYPVGLTFITWTVSDEHDNTSTCVQTVKVRDTEDPVVTCPSDIVQATDADTCSAVVIYDVTATDNCPGVIVDVSPVSGSIFPKGTSTVTATATDASGNMSTCSFTVTIEDRQPPEIACPSDTTVSNDSGLCSAVVIYPAPTASDNCTTVSVESVPPSGSVFPQGETIVTSTATDESGNTTTCTFTVTVNDDEQPRIECPADIAQSTDAGECSAVVHYPDPTASDNCTTVSVESDPPSGSVFPKGETVVTSTATDGSGNTQTCTFKVAVRDDEPPTIECPADISGVECAGPSGTVVEYEVTAGDNCEGATFSCDMPSGETFAIGHTAVTCTVTDAAGNTATCAFNVEVQDTTQPSIECPADVDIGSDDGLCSASIDPGSATASDVCGTTAVDGERSDGAALNDPYPVGQTTILWTAEDEYGNTATCLQTVRVSDDEAPGITCASDIVQGADPDECGAIVTFEVSATDNCPGETVVANPASGSIFPKGTSTVTATATDAAGNTTTCSFSVTIEDRQPPEITCPADVTASNDAGECSAAVHYPQPTATDNCTDVSVECVPPAGSVFPVGNTLVTCTATDGSGNTATCVFTVTVNDNERPIISCPAGIEEVECQSPAGSPVEYEVTIDDNCPGATFECDRPSGETFPIGHTWVSCTATDAVGNTATCSFSVEVRDTVPPALECPPDVHEGSDDGLCSALVQLGEPNACDLCGATTEAGIRSDAAPLADPYPVGITIVTWLAEDEHSNTSTCVQIVDIRDDEAPRPICPGDIVQATDPDQCSAVVTFDVNARDNCPGAAVIANPPSGTTFPHGVSTVTVTASDAAGNTATCTFSVTVEDRQPPRISCPADVAGDTDPGACSAMVAFADPSATDNCTEVSVMSDPPSGSVFDKGQTVVTCTATDGSGNTSTCTFTVTVSDAEPPSIQCPGDIENVECVGADGAPVQYDLAINDNCPGTTFSCDMPSGSTFSIGTTAVTCTATDAAGNTATCGFSIDVHDSTPPSIECPADVEASNDEGFCSATVDPGEPGVSDVCGSASAQGERSDGLALSDAYPVGVTTISWTATDDYGNTSSCAQSVTVVDDEAPRPVCPADIVQATDPDECGAVVTFAATAGDNCPGVTVALSPASGSTFPKGETTVTATATDAAGNTAACTFTVTIEDRQAPEIMCPADMTVSNDPGDCSAVVNYPQPTASDNCTTVSVQCVPPAGSTFPQGQTTVTATATDESGNTTTCTFSVTVDDDERPVLSCPANIVQPNDPGQCSAVVNYTVTATDNCPGTVAIVCNPPSGSTFPKGTTTVTCTATDVAGNSSTCSFTVRINDTELPQITCPPNNVTVGCSLDLLVPVTYSVTATDNCPGVTVVCVPPSGSMFPVGTTTVNCTATDASGNRSTCSFNVVRGSLGFNGFLSPIGGADATGGSFDNPIQTSKLGSTIPVKFQASCGGQTITTGIHILQLIKYSNATAAGSPVDATPTDAATTGNQFRLTGSQWHYNLSTKSGFSQGKWKMVATLSDGSKHVAWIQLKP